MWVMVWYKIHLIHLHITKLTLGSNLFFNGTNQINSSTDELKTTQLKEKVHYFG